MLRSLSFIILLSGASFACPAFAQDTGVAPDGSYIPVLRETQITVLGSGTRERTDTTGQPLSLIDEAEIEQVQGGDITRVLERTPGLTFSRNGGPGAFTGVSLRGAAAEQLLVLIDGVPVADPASPGGGFDFGDLLPAGLGKIEILRGSNGTIWGSQAIGGVLAASTERLAPGLRASAEYGARDTLYAAAAGGIQRGSVELTVDAAGYRTDGFSAAASGTEPDGFRQWQTGGIARVGITDSLSLHGALRYAAALVDIDGFPAPDFVLADTAEYQETRAFSALAGLSFTGADVRLDASWSAADTERDNFDPSIGPAATYSTDGHTDRVDLRGSWQIAGTTLWFGGEGDRAEFSSTYDVREHAYTGGLYAQVGHKFGALTVNVGARVADHSRFGTATTLGADASWKIGGGWRLRASFGEGFKAPTLFQLLSDYGNAALAPERSTSADFGIELNSRNFDRFLSATVFRRDSEGLIDFVSCFGLSTGICTNRPFGTYDNVGRARAQGVELEARQQVVRGVMVRAAYSFIDTEDRTPGSPNEGNRLARRPRQVLSAGGEWQVTDGGSSIGADLRWSSASFDDAANLVRLSPYTVLDLTGRWPLNERIELYGRVENLWNERYQTAAGYASPPRGAFLGARYRW